MAGSSEESLDELPLGDLPPGASDGAGGEAADASSDGGSLDELPISCESEPELDLGDVESGTPDELPLSIVGAEEESAPGGFAGTTSPEAPAQETSLRSRRGPKDRLLLQALAEADALVESLGAQRRPTEEMAVNSRGSQFGALVAQSSSPAVSAASVPPEKLESLLPPVIGGFKVESAVETALGIACQLAVQADANHDPDVLAIGKFFLDQEVMPLMSKRLVCERLSVDDRKLERVVPRLAAAMLRLQEGRRRAVEMGVVSATSLGSRVLFVDCVAYDETPLPVQLRNEQVSLSATDATAPTPSGSVVDTAPPDDRLASFGSIPALKLSTNAHDQKVLQLIQTGGLLLSIKDSFILLKIRSLNGLAIMESGSANSLQGALQQLGSATRAANGFQHQVRVACTDGGSANLPSEKAIVAARGPDCKSLHTLCDVHKTSLIHGKTFSLLDSNVRGMIACALSLRNGAAMTKFRRCLRAEVESRLQILHGRPPPGAENFKRAALHLFVSHGRNLAVRRMLLAMCPNGDWRCHEVQYYAPLGDGAVVDPQSVLTHLTAGLLTALCACRPEVYPRHRWTGCDLATDDLGILEACHGLLSTTYRRMVGDQQPLMSGGIASVDRAGDDARRADADDGQDADVGRRGAEHHGQALVLVGLGVAADSQAPDEEALCGPKANAARRGQALAWLNTAPFGRLVLQRLLMEPLRQLLGRQFEVAGADWEQSQACKAAQAAEEGEAKVASRDFRLTLAAQGEAERKCLEQAQLLWTERNLWAALPESNYTVEFRALSFACLSRLVCATHQLLVVPHQSFPIKMFVLLKRPELAPDLASVPECLLDPWSLDMRRRHPDLSDSTFMHKLLLIALLQKVDISAIEARHASVRRLLTASSVQTHKLSFEELSAQWLFMQARTKASDPAVWQSAVARKASARRQAAAQRNAHRQACGSMCVGVWGGGGGVVQSLIQIRDFARIPGRGEFPHIAGQSRQGHS